MVVMQKNGSNRIDIIKEEHRGQSISFCLEMQRMSYLNWIWKEEGEFLEQSGAPSAELRKRWAKIRTLRTWRNADCGWSIRCWWWKAKNRVLNERSQTMNGLKYHSRELDFGKFYNVLKIPVPSTLLGYLYMLLDAQQPPCRHKIASFWYFS